MQSDTARKSHDSISGPLIALSQTTNARPVPIASDSRTLCGVQGIGGSSRPRSITRAAQDGPLNALGWLFQGVRPWGFLCSWPGLATTTSWWRHTMRRPGSSYSGTGV